MAKKKAKKKVAKRRAIKMTGRKPSLSVADGGIALYAVAMPGATRATHEAYVKAIPPGISGRVVERGVFEFKVTQSHRPMAYADIESFIELANDLNAKFLKRKIRSALVLWIKQGGTQSRIEVDLGDPIWE